MALGTAICNLTIHCYVRQYRTAKCFGFYSHGSTTVSPKNLAWFDVLKLIMSATGRSNRPGTKLNPQSTTTTERKLSLAYYFFFFLMPSPLLHPLLEKTRLGKGHKGRIVRSPSQPKN